MKTVGIIAEYNPFHNGHAYQIDEIKKRTGADYVIIAMSGNFVQRGTPAIIDKYARTQMALCCGADLVLELPTLWATASAEDFATAGVTLLDQLGCVDFLCFGAESNDLAALLKLAAILTEEPDVYKAALSDELKKGQSFPTARRNALASFCAYSELLDSPNNILAIEYLKALRRRDSSMKPFLIQREGFGYHDTDLSVSVHPSATGIRKLLFSEDVDWSLLKGSMPEEAYAILSNYSKEYPFIDINNFSIQLNYRLLLEQVHGYESFRDISNEISNRLLKNRYQFLSFSQFCELNKSRDITYTRINRALLHLLLNITDEAVWAGKALDYIPYLRPLGFRKTSSFILSVIKRNSHVPLISKLADAHKVLSKDSFDMLSIDIFSADLYEQVLSAKKSTFPRSEFTREIVLL